MPAIARGKRVGRNEPAELLRAQLEHPRELRRERHDHHEIERGGELDCRQSQQHAALARRVEGLHVTLRYTV